MVGLNGFFLLRSAYTIRNISTTSYLCRRKPQVAPHVVFINKSSEPGELQISLGIQHDKQVRRVGFIRPMSNTIEKSFDRMRQKIQRETCCSDEFALELYNPADTSVKYESSTWESLLDILPSLRLRVNKQEYEILYDFPVIKRIDLPKYATIGLDLYPIIVDHSGELADFQFQWYRKTARSKWLPCDNQTQMYHCSQDDAGALLKLKGRGLFNGFETSTVESNATECVHEVDSPLIDERHQYTPHSLADPAFRVCSYNVLADFYASSEYSKETLFNYCDEKFLNWDYRERLLQKEIFGYHSDIYCLQEIDDHFYHKGLFPSLRFRCMDAVFERKGATQEGLAIMYNTDKFK